MLEKISTLLSRILDHRSNVPVSAFLARRGRCKKGEGRRGAGERERAITPPFPPSSPTPLARPATHAQDS